MAHLVDDAIAHARQVKSTALANAKIALEETFQPTLRSMISQKLAEEEELEGEEDVDIDVNYDEEGAAKEESGVGFGSFEGDPAAEEVPEEESEEDLELEAFLRELDGEEEEVMEEGEEEEWQDPIPDEEVDPVMEGEDMEDFELEEALNAMLSEEEGLGDDLDQGENHEDGSVFDETPPSGPQFLENRRLKRENANLKKQFNEALRALTTYKKTLNEVNLLNAKLMFTTKTLRRFDLNEHQQIRILESFDRATSVREVKLVYTTIVESFNKKSPKKVTEGLASKTIKAINPSRKQLNEGNTDIVDKSLVDRFQTLAGMRRDEF